MNHNNESDNTNNALFIETPPLAVPNSVQSDDEERERTIRERTVRVNHEVFEEAVKRAEDADDFGQLEAEELKVNLFDGVELEVSMENVRRYGTDKIVIVGRIEDQEESAVTLVMNKNVLVGDIRQNYANRSFEVRYLGRGLHTVKEIEDGKSQDCNHVIPEAEEELDFGIRPAVESEQYEYGAQPMRAFDAQSMTAANIGSDPIIDVLVAYTPEAAALQGGEKAIRALIDLGVADTNRAFIDSGLNLSVRLAGVMQVKRNDSGQIGADLRALKGKIDGRWDEVHAERERLGADQVTLIGAYNRKSSASGIGYFNANAQSAFTIVKSNSFSQYTFAHELGHNLGLNHSDGYVNHAGRFRTIIAYGNYPRIRRFSNPRLLYNGYKTGDNRRNEVAILSRNAMRVSSLVASKAAPLR